MAPDLIDTHCHLDQEPLAADIEAVLGRARAAGVQACISIRTTLEASRANVELARRINLSPAACLERVKRLQNDGVIQRYVARALERERDEEGNHHARAAN